MEVQRNKRFHELLMKMQIDFKKQLWRAILKICIKRFKLCINILDIYPKKIIALRAENACISIFTVALFIMVKLEEKCPIANDWLNKV